MYTKKDLFRLFFPAFIEQLLIAAIGVVNTMMVSGLGSYAVSAVSIVDSINFVTINIFAAVATGATVVVSQHIGAHNKYTAIKTASQSITAVLILAILTGAVLYIFDNQIIGALFGKAEESVKSSARIYMACSAISYPFLGLFSAITGTLRASSNFKAPMVAGIISNVANVLAGALFIFVFDLGVLGAGIALIVARIFGCLVVLNPVRPHVASFSFKTFKENYWVESKILKPVLFIGIPAGVDSLIFNGGKLLVQTIITGLGTAALAANSIANSINAMINIPGAAFTIIAVTVIGQYSGSEHRNDIKKMTLRLTGYSMAMLAVVSLAFAPFAGFVISLYSPEPDVYKMVLEVTYMTLICIPIFWSAAFVAPACLRSTGDAVFVTVISVASMWIVRVLGAYIIIEFTSFGLFGIWIVWCCDWVVRGVPFLIRVISKGYEKHLPKLEKDTPVEVKS